MANRVRQIVGQSSPIQRRRSRSFSPTSQACSPSPKRRSVAASSSPPNTPPAAQPQSDRSPTPASPELPSTQPLGESDLAAEYRRPACEQRSLSPDELLIQAPPRIGLSQAVREEFQREEATLTQRSEVALSQAVRRRELVPDEHEDVGAGCFTPSQVASKLACATPQSYRSPSSSFMGGRFATQTPSPLKFQSQPFRAGGTRGPGRFPLLQVDDAEARANAARAARRRAIAVALA